MLQVQAFLHGVLHGMQVHFGRLLAANDLRERMQVYVIL